MGYLNTLLKDIFRGTSEGDGTGDGARDAGKIINDNFDQVDNALQEIDTNAEKKTNRVTNLDLPSDTQYPTSKAVSDALSGLQTGWESYTDEQLTQYQQTSEKGQANGYAPLDATGLVPTANLPAYVEEIVEGTYINSTTFNDGGGSPITPATNKIYVDTTTSKVYRWGGSTFAEIVASPGTTDEVPEGTNNKYFTADRVRAVLLTGYEVVVGFTVSVTDNIVTAIGKLQGQINLINISLAGKLVKGGYTGTAQDLKDLIDTKQTALQVQTLIDQHESSAQTFSATENEHGTHPAFASQNEAIIWLLQNGGGTPPNTAPTISGIPDQNKAEGYSSYTIDLSTYASDADSDSLTYSASSDNESLATVSVSGSILTITEVSGQGTANITATVDDGTDTANDVFVLNVGPPAQQLNSPELMTAQNLKADENKITWLDTNS